MVSDQAGAFGAYRPGCEIIERRATLYAAALTAFRPNLAFVCSETAMFHAIDDGNAETSLPVDSKDNRVP